MKKVSSVQVIMMYMVKELKMLRIFSYICQIILSVERKWMLDMLNDNVSFTSIVFLSNFTSIKSRTTCSVLNLFFGVPGTT